MTHTKKKKCFPSYASFKNVETNVETLLNIQYVHASHLGWVRLVPSGCGTPRSVRRERTWPGCRSHCISSTPCRWTAFCPPPLSDRKGGENKWDQRVGGKKAWSRDQHLISTSSLDTHNSKFSFGSLWSFLSMTQVLSFPCNLCALPSSPPGMILFTNSEAVIMMWWAFLVEIKWMRWAISFFIFLFYSSP